MITAINVASVKLCLQIRALVNSFIPLFYLFDKSIAKRTREHTLIFFALVEYQLSIFAGIWNLMIELSKYSDYIYVHTDIASGEV